MTGYGRMRTVEVAESLKENPFVTTIMFKDSTGQERPAPALPGQFIMAWLPGKGEVPMGLTYTGPETKGFSVHALGPVSKALAGLKQGEKIGIKGPLGNGFSLPKEGKKVLAIAGGTGMAPMAPLLEQLASSGFETTACIGAKTKDHLFMTGRLEKAGVRTLIATDDGSLGHKGFVTDLAAKLMEENGPHEKSRGKGGYAMIYACGPEPMMKKIHTEAMRHHIPVQLSLERYMKCGIGICDSCSIGGLQVCKDGPVFTGETLAQEKMAEFGKFRRGPSGKKETL